MADTPTSGLDALSLAATDDLLGLIRSGSSPKRKSITYEDFVKGIRVLASEPNPALTDYLVVVHDLAGTPTAYRITVGDFLNSLNLFGANLPSGRWAMVTGSGEAALPLQYVGDAQTTTGLVVAQAAVAGGDASKAFFRTQAGTDRSGSAGGTIWLADDNVRLRAVLSRNNSTNTRCWACMTDGTLATIGASTAPVASLVGFRYDPFSGDSGWRACWSDGVTFDSAALGAASTDSPNVLEVQLDLADGEARYYYNNSLVHTATANLPASGALLRYVAVANVGAAATYGDMNFYHLYIEADK